MAGRAGVVPYGSDPSCKSLQMIQKRSESSLGDEMSDGCEHQCFKEEKEKVKVTKIHGRADSM